MRTQGEKLRISIAVMVLSILLVIVMLLVQAHPAKVKESSVAPKSAGTGAVLPLSPEKLYAQAEGYSSSGDYLGALKALAKIDETWPQYSLAAGLSKECEEKLLAEVSSPATIEEYLECERKVNEYLEVKTSPAFLDRKQQLVRDRDAFIAAAPVIEKARPEFESGDYGAAFGTLESALKDSPENRFINETLEEFRGVFVGEVTQKAEEEIQNRNYDEALTIVNDALDIYDCEELHQVRKHIMEEADPLYGVYNDLKNSAEEWFGSWIEDSEDVEYPSDLWYYIPDLI